MDSVVVAYGLSCPEMWDLPGPGIESTFPALTGGFFTTGPPGKSLLSVFGCGRPFVLRFQASSSTVAL